MTIYNVLTRCYRAFRQETVNNYLETASSYSTLNSLSSYSKMPRPLDSTQFCKSILILRSKPTLRYHMYPLFGVQKKNFYHSFNLNQRQAHNYCRISVYRASLCRPQLLTKQRGFSLLSVFPSLPLRLSGATLVQLQDLHSYR